MRNQTFIFNQKIFQSLTNWGREDLTTDLTADDDSIQVVAFFSVPNPLGDASATNSIGWKLDYGDAFLEGTTDVAVQDQPYPTLLDEHCSDLFTEWRLVCVHFFLNSPDHWVGRAAEAEVLQQKTEA